MPFQGGFCYNRPPKKHTMTDTTLQVISIAAIIVGPIAALLAQRVLDHFRENRKRKLALLQTLMTSRAVPLSIAHVQALNSIELEFYPRDRRNNRRVVDAWHIYSGHLNLPTGTDPAPQQAWETRRQDLIVDLLYEMSQSLGYDLPKDMIKRDAYYPSGLGAIETESAALRKAALNVFEGRQALIVKQ
jgi:hypothetical protein